ncbi:MAG: hypothetical protein MZV70_10505 [Desulfobacterales bacterium]|nr:hypothetical protein [Desulfobacterales bacterium]
MRTLSLRTKMICTLLAGIGIVTSAAFSICFYSFRRGGRGVRRRPRTLRRT